MNIGLIHTQLKRGKTNALCYNWIRVIHWLIQSSTVPFYGNQPPPPPAALDTSWCPPTPPDAPQCPWCPPMPPDAPNAPWHPLMPLMPPMPPDTPNFSIEVITTDAPEVQHWFETQALESLKSRNNADGNFASVMMCIRNLILSWLLTF